MYCPWQRMGPICSVGFASCTTRQVLQTVGQNLADRVVIIGPCRGMCSSASCPPSTATDTTQSSDIQQRPLRMTARLPVGCAFPFTKRLQLYLSLKDHVMHFCTSTMQPSPLLNSSHRNKRVLSLTLPIIDSGICYMSFGKRTYVSRKTYPFSELKDDDLEEDFVRGSGPGGQAVNQTANCVVLKHTPTGIVVKCHETRSLQINRQRARERLKERIDFHLHGSKSFLALQEKESSLQRKEKKKRNKSRLETKKAFKEREGID